jgi:hypothetical protein
MVSQIAQDTNSVGFTDDAEYARPKGTTAAYPG